ncbi:hypothetical protein A3B42_03165 [Candidatus Daviesbacteria bacterium RIFCSPLOWO2_01_FULL_38_10]|nr:MAG: hypothetical protein A3D02_02495 [Candidatus Daviesbacteria bacterium RIFCSPHIGHO2_02_FULL_39_41]OGE39184.1 MAG: hypothetical protein A3B42_03165 [Candidatus Daviesbacteria bacterium RIFCSPLOWO2_01_FULL_38_10]OGE45189.1 MAG: hypothetical protein A3E67_03220 [Candidatus Daviesbacteria bacterium RIFCSPHIGHO2_12_FULL_38_25]OGE68381.1 MAG: hypothetical protein A3H81_02495 [Candidatus Daviesbacteria bacterium RIFCSPLOWO2_02_FULL_38_18]OGE72178.1 MAG: hypothetical protein A3H18_01650 [Candida
MKINQKGFIQIMVILILLLGLAVGVYLVQHPQIFKSRAYDNFSEQGFTQAFNSKRGDPNYNEQYDANKDGVINTVDKSLLQNMFGWSKESLESIPQKLSGSFPIRNENVIMFNGAPEGSLTVYGLSDNGRTAIDLGPTRGVLPNEHALAEVVLYRTQDQKNNFERMNWTAGSATIPHYRFGVERGGSGQFRDIVFAFEDVTPGKAEIPFIISADSVNGSHYLAIQQGHLVFITPSMGGEGSSFYIGRGGDQNLDFNAPSDGNLEFLIGNKPVGVFSKSGLRVHGLVTDDGKLLEAPDYVFESGYNLKSLEQVEQFILENKHLEGLPDASDIQGWANLSLQEREMKLLEKIEELTLYIIDLNKKIQMLQN